MSLLREDYKKSIASVLLAVVSVALSEVTAIIWAPQNMKKRDMSVKPYMTELCWHNVKELEVGCLLSEASGETIALAKVLMNVLLTLELSKAPKCLQKLNVTVSVAQFWNYLLYISR